MMVNYGNARELLGVKKYHGKEGKIDMCKGLEGMLEDSRMEGHAEGRKEGHAEGFSQGQSVS